MHACFHLQIILKQFVAITEKLPKNISPTLVGTCIYFQTRKRILNMILVIQFSNISVPIRPIWIGIAVYTVPRRSTKLSNKDNYERIFQLKMITVYVPQNT